MPQLHKHFNVSCHFLNHPTTMEDYLKGAFIYGVGINSEEFVIDIANNHVPATYRIWVDTSVECELKTAYQNKGLDEDEITLLALNQLRYLTITEVRLNSNEDLDITFETDVHLKIYGSNAETSCVEPWRFYQLTPEDKLILIVSNK